MQRQDGDITTVISSHHMLLAQAVCSVGYLPVSLIKGLIIIVERSYMEKILSLGLTGKKLLAQGFLFVLLGLILMVTGTWLPVTVIRLVLFFSLDSNGLRFSITYFQKSQSTDTLGVALVKLLVMGYLLGSNLATDVPIYILALVIGVSQIFHASINLVTYVLYRKNKIRPRFRFLLDGLVLVFLGGTSLCPLREILSFNSLY